MELNIRMTILNYINYLTDFSIEIQVNVWEKFRKKCMFLLNKTYLKIKNESILESKQIEK